MTRKHDSRDLGIPLCRDPTFANMIFLNEFRYLFQALAPGNAATLRLTRNETAGRSGHYGYASPARVQIEFAGVKKRAAKSL